MKHTLMELPFKYNELEPHISRETLEYHHGKLHRGYVDNLNKLVKGTNYENMGLLAIILSSEGSIFNNASQVYNHNFYFEGMNNRLTTKSKHLQGLIERNFSSFFDFKKEFLKTSLDLFGSGWVWLCLDHSGALVIKSFSNADNPLTNGFTPLIACDVWEHSYYIDNRNERDVYLEKWWSLIDWDVISNRLETFADLRHGFISFSSKNDELGQYIDEIEHTERVNT